MKILITTDLFTTATNGVVTSVKNLWDELKKKGHDVRILTLSEKSHSYREGKVYYIRSASFPIYPDVRMPLSLHHRLIKDLIDWKPDVIHSQCEFFTYFFATYVARHTGAPIVHTFHTMYEQYVGYVIPYEKFGRAAVRVAMKKRLQSAKCVIAPTGKVKDALKDYGVTPPIAIIPSGISLDQHKLRITPEERREKRRALGIADDEFVLVNLGRLGTEKNIDELIRFYARSLKKHPKLRFLIVGGGPAREELEAQAHELGVAGRVVFAGMVNPAEVQKYYQLGDLFVSASTSETQGLTYIEASANGLPLLCRRDPCLDEILLEGDNGYTYVNYADFAKKLDFILSDSEWREKAARRSEVISARFDKVNFGNAVEKLYRIVIKSKKRRKISK